MRTMWTFVGFFRVPLLCLFCLTKDTVDSAELSGPELVNAPFGGSVTVSCQYDKKFQENSKYWCRGAVYELCSVVVRTPRNILSGRSSISDDKEAGVITVTIHSLGQSDEDMYWCVISRSGRNVYTGVRLQVSPTITTPESLSLENDELSWWVTLRWILFIFMLCCLVVTHITEWRIIAAKKTAQQQQLHHQTLNIYE